MEESTVSPFLNAWHYAMIIGANLLLLGGIGYYLFYTIRLSSIRNYKAKHDYISLNEIRSLKMVFVCFGLAALMAINLYGMGEVLQMGIWFFVRFFISIAGGTLVVYVAFLVLEYYYPSVLHKKLTKWRYMPRVSQSGNEMRLLSEEEEDVHLEEGMRAEENVFSVDYDVWVDEKTKEVKIEKYAGHLKALQCNTCGFYTMKVNREEITRQPTRTTPGELIKHYQCSYCKSVRATAFNISTKDADDYKGLTSARFKKNNAIDLVHVEIHTTQGGKKFFEFQNLDQAVKFLQEFDTEKHA